MSVRADTQTLLQLPVFKGCDPVALQILAFAAERQDFGPGDDIITKGKKSKAAYLILDGKVSLHDGEDAYGFAEAGALLGEMSMLRQGPYTITGTAEGPVATVAIAPALFARVTQEFPDFGKMVLRNLSERLELHMRELESVRAALTRARSFSDLG
ncbi:Crp/Fnr family transcriptional regulator [Aestuariivirga litoralis]|uniref:Crp/Fnr family transcriptional regulator n=1 Tax=Aestuariivirga litoralis TaxID=2650924 RepID=UPI0018C4A353|nr:Crp/Fnr family transcriptional regulator [Aestuariivirga litoralis]MBG1233759.1 Crp/Fnr family transcriptional regulator [Aestuariivirga litoralis]